MTLKYNQVDGDLQKEIEILKEKIKEKDSLICKLN